MKRGILLVLIAATLLGFLPALSRAGGLDFIERLLGSIFPVTLTPLDLRARYHTSKVKVLIIPGHDNEYHGAEFGGLRESDLTLQTGRALYELLKNDERFSALSVRDFRTGAYTDEFAIYFTREADAIRSVRDRTRALMDTLVTARLVERNHGVPHGFAPGEAATRLYGINKWANENDIDIALHIHFNDYPRRRRNSPGEYSGFSIYVPEVQYPNAATSAEVARSVFEELKTSLPQSDLPKERGGILEDQELIAVGSNASREGASLLIEYGYLYESKFMDPTTRKVFITELAFLTYRGLKNYFEDETGDGILDRRTTLLPYSWNTPLQVGMRGDPHVLALQAALRAEDLYPPPGKSMNECPLNGNFGPCVERSVILFQEKYRDEVLFPASLTRGTGTVGPATLKKLNELYGT